MTTNTSRLDAIVQHGNRGHRHISNNQIVCADGLRLSVIAGGGTYCSPEPAHSVPHDFPGPYTALEVMVYGTERPWDGGEVHSDYTLYGWVRVEIVRTLIQAHGGER